MPQKKIIVYRGLSPKEAEAIDETLSGKKQHFPYGSNWTPNPITAVDFAIRVYRTNRVLEVMFSGDLFSPRGSELILNQSGIGEILRDVRVRKPNYPVCKRFTDPPDLDLLGEYILRQ